MSFQLAYCTNVHAGSDLTRTTANLREHALGVKRRFSPHAPMGIGLWLAAAAARELRAAGQLAAFAGWLADHGLVPFTLNGFPHGDFHETVVKHRVYRPAWFETARLDYTLDLVTILDAILPSELEGSISTLPVAWGDPPLGELELRQAAANLLQVARRLAELESETGRLVYLCLEPEPGCVLQRGSDVVRFFDEHLLRGGNEDQVLRYLRVCHDVCHAAVMFEDQGEVLARYAAAGIKVGKLQVSSAIRLDLDPLDPAERTAALSELALFAEDRYLHQTMIRSTAGAAPQFFEDLPDPLRQALGGARRSHGQWRVHFHVPIYLVQFGRLGTTRDEIERCLAAIQGHPELRHLEVETYAWNVLPLELREPELADGIARELQWLADLPGVRC
jgi:sugar phosphate isomerase/epimerase